jgi:alkylation response protein AidB-like acyl-CoA dehydrogenase
VEKGRPFGGTADAPLSGEAFARRFTYTGFPIGGRSSCGRLQQQREERLSESRRGARASRDPANQRKGGRMNFGFSEEQELLRAEVRKFLDQNAPLDEVRKIVETPEGFDRHLWARMAELGWVGLTVPDEYGGVGLDFVTLVVLLEETGRTLFPSPLLSTFLAAKAIERSGTPEQRARWLPGLAGGATIGTLALLEESDSLEPEGVRLVGKRDGDAIVLSGDKRIVPDAGVADLFVVAFRSGQAADAVSLAVIESAAGGLQRESLPGIDHTKRSGHLHLDGVRVAPDALLGEAGGAWPEIAWLVDAGATAVAAETAGAAEAALALVTDFASQREQFGQKIGRFQGVKHPLAEMYVDIESFKSLVYYAAWCIDEASADRSPAASRAKAYAAEAFARIGIDSVQLHGAVGYTDEYDVQLYLKRSKWARPSFGDSDYHYDRIARLGGL